MSTFYNRATLTYKDKTTDSNTVSGTLIEVLTVQKTALEKEYQPNDTVTFMVSLTNRGSTSYKKLKLTDDLGGYSFESEEGKKMLVPMTYIKDSVRYLYDGNLKDNPSAEIEDDKLVITDIDVPANGTTLILYDAVVNKFAPLGNDASITNTVTVTEESNNLAFPISDSTTIIAADKPYLTVSKSLSPQTVIANEELTYTFIIQNYGNKGAVGEDNVVLTDTFKPVLDLETVKFNTNTWVKGTDYFYENGLFTTRTGKITVGSAIYTQDSRTGEWNIEPGVSTLTVSGIV